MTAQRQQGALHMPDGMLVPARALDGEVLSGPHVIVHPHPWQVARTLLDVPSGLTLAEIVDRSAINPQHAPFVRVWIEDHEIPRERWRVVRPKDGRLVLVSALPHGGGGGGGKKNPIAAILSLVVAVAAAVVAPYLAGLVLGAGGTIFGLSAATSLALVSGAIGATINLVGNLVIAALVPPPDQTPQLASDSSSAIAAPQYQITGSSNRAAPYAPIPRILGKRRIYPVLGARPWTESIGGRQYLRMLLVCGYGPLRISDIKIGDTALTDFGNDINYEIREGWPTDIPVSLYTNAVFENTFNIALVAGASPILRTSHADTQEISLDFTFPRGLAYYDTNGNPGSTWLVFTVSYIGPTGAFAAAFTNLADQALEDLGSGSFKITRASRDAVHIGVRFLVPTAGTYSVYVNCGGGDDPSNARVVNGVAWTCLRSVQYVNPLPKPGLAVITLMMLATDRLNGVPDQISCLAESYLQAWNGSSWAWQISRNPAWAYADILKRRGTETLLADSRIDLDGMKDWADACDASAPDRAEPYWTCDAVVEGGSVFSALRQIASSGRAAFTMKDGKFSVVRDISQSTPVMHITPRNSWGYSGRKSFIDLPHAIKVRFINEDAGYQEEERYVYDDGYNAANATRFETLDMPTCVRSTQAWREGRYHIAVGRLRPEEHSVTMDMESLRGTLGDLVRFAHDAVSIGLAQGRLVEVADDGSDATSFVLDGDVTMADGLSYAIRCRRKNGDSIVISLITVAGNTDTVTPVTPVPLATAPEAGDLVLFGIASLESAAMVIKRIEPGPDLTARVTMVDAQAGVWTADSGTIPPFQTNITHNVPRAQRKPPLVGAQLRSDETALVRLRDGSIQERIAVDIAPPPSGDVPISDFDVQARLSGLDAWSFSQRVDVAVRTVYVSPVVAGEMWDVRVRAVSQYRVSGDWYLISGHTVTGKTNPPPVPERVLIENDLLVATYDDAPIDFLGFRVLYDRGITANMERAVSAHPTTTVVQLPFDLSQLPGGNITLWLLAVDTSGNESDAVRLVRDLDGADVVNEIDVVDLKALGFPGSITGGSISGGNLVADGDATSYLPDDDAPYLSGDSTSYLPVQYSEIVWEFELTPDSIDVPSQLSFEAAVAGQGWKLEYIGDDGEIYLPLDGDPYLGADGDDYLPSLSTYGAFPAGVQVDRVAYGFRVTVFGGIVQGVVSQFDAVFDVPDEEEELEDLVLASGGTRVPITKTYREIRHVGITLQDDGNHADSVRRIDYDPVLGPLLQAFNNNVAVAALVDVRVKGVRG